MWHVCQYNIALAVLFACGWAYIFILSAHHLRGLCSQAAFAVRVRTETQPASLAFMHQWGCCWHLSSYTHKLVVSLVMWYYFIGPSPARLVLPGCIRFEGSQSLQTASLARMHLSGRCWLLSSYTRKPVVSLVMWYYSIGPSPARLVLPGCIHLEGSHSLQPASLAFMHQWGCCSPFSSYTHKPVISLVIPSLGANKSCTGSYRTFGKNRLGFRIDIRFFLKIRVTNQKFLYGTI